VVRTLRSHRPARRRRARATMTVPTCACGCGEPLLGRRRGTIYINRTHGQRAYRRRVQAAMTARGLPASLSLRTANTTNPPESRNGDRRASREARQPRRLTPGQVRLSYPRALDMLVAEFKRVNMNDPERRARQVLDPLLTDRQREALRG
jgi:hypothetical protein